MPNYTIEEMLVDANAEVERLSCEGRAKNAVIEAARLVYKANGHEQVQRHIRRMGTKLYELDTASEGQTHGT